MKSLVFAVVRITALGLVLGSIGSSVLAGSSSLPSTVPEVPQKSSPAADKQHPPTGLQEVTPRDGKKSEPDPVPEIPPMEDPTRGPTSVPPEVPPGCPPLCTQEDQPEKPKK